MNIPIQGRPTAARKCKLQINQIGAWRDVCEFDCDSQGTQIKEVAPALAAVVNANLRIVMANRRDAPLLFWSSDCGWRLG